jgi:PAS domain S-box-containing protein
MSSSNFEFLPQELATLLDAIQDYAIFGMSPDGVIRSWNTGAAATMGYSADEIVGKHFSIFYGPEDIESRKPQRELETAAREGRIEDEGWRIRKDGTRFWANTVITAVYDAEGGIRGFAKVTRDMTERKHAEEMQRALLEQREARLLAEAERQRAEASYRVAQESNRAKDEFLMTLSHELRTPLTSILGWARMLSSMDPNDPSFRDALGAISRSAQLQARLIDDVLDVSRIVSGKLRLSVEEISLSRLLSESVEAVRPSADAKGISLTTTLASRLGVIVADATRLQQVVWNLLTNAVKFTPKGGSVELSARRTSSHVQIMVTDSGEGIEPSFVPHVFEPFRQAENPSTRVHGGLGLGLSIVRYLAEAHGGTVSAASAGRGKGATFTVTLPIGALTSHERSTTNAATPDLPIAAQLDGVRILLIDDDVEGRQLVKAVLTQAGASVTAAGSAQSALDAFATSRPDLVITDIAMPFMDGYALARRIREQAPDQKIVALTAFPAGSGARDTAFERYLIKPVEPTRLVREIAQAVGR